MKNKYWFYPNIAENNIMIEYHYFGKTKKKCKVSVIHMFAFSYSTVIVYYFTPVVFI